MFITVFLIRIMMLGLRTAELIYLAGCKFVETLKLKANLL